MIKPVSKFNIKAYNPYFMGVSSVKNNVKSDDIIENMFNEYMSQLEEKNPRSSFEKENIIKQKHILEDNKEETKRLLGLLYDGLKVDYKKRKVEHDRKNWRPSMSRKEASDYCKDSAIIETLYRTTRLTEANRKFGYKLSEIGATYPGIYLAVTRQDAEIYGGTPLKVMADINNYESYQLFKIKEESIINKEVRSPEVKEALHKTIGVLGNVLAKQLNIEAFIDCKDIFDDGNLRYYYSVVDPKNIVVINE